MTIRVFFSYDKGLDLWMARSTVPSLSAHGKTLEEAKALYFIARQAYAERIIEASIQFEECDWLEPDNQKRIAAERAEECDCGSACMDCGELKHP